MREFRNYALAAIAALSMLAAPEYMDAQVRRTTTTQNNTTKSSSTQSKSSSSSSSSQARRSTSSSSSSSQVRSGSSSSSASRSAGTTSSSSSQVRRTTGSTGSSSSQVRSGSSSSSASRSAGTTSSSSSQVRRTTGSTSSSSGQVRNSSSSSQVRSSGSSSSSQVRSSASSSHRVAQPVRGGSTASSSSQTRNQAATSQVRRNTNVTKTGLSTVTSQMRTQPGSSSSGRDVSKTRGGMYDDFRIDNHSVQRIHPCDRDFIQHERLHHFYGHHPHYFGYRVQILPPGYVRHTYFGVNYYVCNDIYYRPFRGHYVVCRPPFGVVVNAALADLAFSAVRFSYYSNVYNTYRAINENNRYIDQQNRIIARNNATIMAQNQAIAMNPGMAKSAYQIAEQLGLMQSYAYADREYYYEDGVFYIINDNGRYQTIVPPAGALVQSLPDDYDTLTLGGVEYYRVDDTVYRLTLVEGVPYLEVLGQMYGSMARKYNSYYDN
ncbi:MAG: DUF6515 family protein [Candidatus Cryptobacteroides sp.]